MQEYIKKILGSGTTTLIISNDEMEDIIQLVRMMRNQRSDTEKINLIEEGKKIGIDQVIKRNEFINNSLKYQI